jgi:hypothetical protein
MGWAFLLCLSCLYAEASACASGWRATAPPRPLCGLRATWRPKLGGPPALAAAGGAPTPPPPPPAAGRSCVAIIAPLPCVEPEARRCAARSFFDTKTPGSLACLAFRRWRHSMLRSFSDLKLLRCRPPHSLTCSANSLESAGDAHRENCDQPDPPRLAFARPHSTHRTRAARVMGRCQQ